jgi:CRP/FNR family transcriptional regulator, dissimilatory nitrate respiration regulator
MIDHHGDVYRLLRSHYLFHSLSDLQLRRVVARAHRIALEGEEWLFAQGDPASRFYLVAQGRIKLFFLTSDGNDKVIDVIEAEGTIAEALMFLRHPAYPISASALEPAQLICLDAQDFALMLRESVDTCLLLLGNLSRRLHDMLREIRDLSTRNASCRVANYLLRAAPPGKNSFRLEVPKGILASRLSVKPETFSRIIRQLSDKKIVSVRGSLIQIHDRAALATQADNSDLDPDGLDAVDAPPIIPLATQPH